MAVESWGIWVASDHRRASVPGISAWEESYSPAYEGKRDKDPDEEAVQSHNEIEA
ncbi:MAG: hypothetical protein WBE11_02950 [Candidatus Aminicenantaceae bacterium]